MTTQAAGKRLPRGIRNNNPGNIRLSKTQWQGATGPQTDPDFVVFDEPRWGIRAIARTLITYQDKRKAADGSKIDTVAEVIHRWAPPNENDTEAYANHVARIMTLGANDAINVHQYDHLEPLVKAIIRHENGVQPYSQAEIDAGLRLAGVEPAPKPLAKTKTIQASTAAGVTGSLAMVTQAVNDLQPAMPLVQQLVDKVPYVVGAVVVVLALYWVYQRVKERKETGR